MQWYGSLNIIGVILYIFLLYIYPLYMVVVVLSCLTLGTPWTVPDRLLSPWDFPGKNTGVNCHFLLQGIALSLGSNPGLLYCRRILYHQVIWKASILYTHTHTHTHVSSSPNCRSMCFKLNNSLLLTLGLLEGPLFSLSPVPGSLCLGGLFSSCCPGPVFQKATTLTWR